MGFRDPTVVVPLRPRAGSFDKAAGTVTLTYAVDDPEQFLADLLFVGEATCPSAI